MGVAAVVAAVVYAAMWVGFTRQWAWLVALDTALLRTCHEIGVSRPGWVVFWVQFCEVFSPNVFRLLGLVVVIAAVVRRRLQTALFLLFGIGLMGFFTESAKWLGDRPRPATALAYGMSTFFPSGHALGATVGVLSLMTVLWPLLSGRWRMPTIAIGAALVVLVGVGRVAVNVHYPSDVVAGWALGFLYYLLCLRLVPPRAVTATAGTTPELDSAR